MSMLSFKERVLKVVQSIPKGSVLSYAEVARRAGNKRAARAVGAMMRANRSVDIPCHRVVASDGTIGGFNRGAKEKARLLRAEGVAIHKGVVVVEN